jgi:HAD superfamily hydrolase (TIGR01549 family)
MDGDPRRWVVLDVGETIIGESRLWLTWADVLGVPPMTFMSAFGSLVERGLGYRDLSAYFSGHDWEGHRAAVDARFGGFRADDLYPDALPALTRLREQGYRTAVMGNQRSEKTAELLAVGVSADVVAMSGELGAEKPAAAFFAAALERLGRPSAHDVAYVGDRIDFDVRASAAAGLRPVWLRRGPWGLIPRERPPEAALVVDSLIELADRMGEAWP